jgi:hypothetical protein
MSLVFSQGKLKSEERQVILESIQTPLQPIITQGVTLVLQEFLEQEVTAKLGRAKRRARQVSSQPRLIAWQCAGCGCRDANQFTRDGHYQRSLQTGWGDLQALRVPMRECQCCQHDVVAHFAILEKHRRFWLDAGHRAIFGSGLCQSLRQREYNNGQRHSAQASGGERSMNELISSKRV